MNILFIMSDEHSNSVMGCSGHDVVKTPVLDRLAEQGTMYTNCYTNCPVCVPARASFFTGYYANRLGTWDNATPYDGYPQGISQYLKAHGHSIVSFGKWDFHPDGIYDGLSLNLPVHRINPQYESSFRDTDICSPDGASRFSKMGIREKECFDDRVRNAAVDFLKNRSKDDEPWIMYVGFLHPHFPFFPKREYWEYYDEIVKDIPDVAKGPFDELNEPLKKLRRFFRGETVEEETIRKAHVGYYSMVSELDENIGILLDVLKEQGLEEDTLVIYTSDHGEQLGHHGLWWKCCMYEESSHIPLIMKGPGIEEGLKISDPVSLVDLFPTVCSALDIPVPGNIDGESLLDFTKESYTKKKDFAFSEYHAHGIDDAVYMIRWKDWKYVYYVGYEPQLFNLKDDPEELHDLAADDNKSEGIEAVISECKKRLMSICDPDEVNARAKRFQNEIRGKLEEKGFSKDNFNIRSLEEVPHPKAIV